MAAMVPYTNPWAPLMSQMWRWMDGGGTARDGSGSDEGTLPVDIYETPEALVVKAAVPGFTSDQIDVQVEKGILSIKAQAKEQEGTPEGRYYRREIDWSSCSRRIALPGVVDDAQVQARLKDGVLTLHLPISERARPRHITVEA